MNSLEATGDDVANATYSPDTGSPLVELPLPSDGSISAQGVFHDAARELPRSLDNEADERLFLKAAREVVPLVRTGAIEKGRFVAFFQDCFDPAYFSKATELLARALSEAPPQSEYLPEPALPDDDWQPPLSETAYGLPVATDLELDEIRTVPLASIDVSRLEGLPPDREWLIRDRLPMGNLNILSGDGAAGKTTIALQLGVAVVLEQDWLGERIEKPGPVVFLTAEEDLNEIWRRLHSILANRGMTLADLSGRGFHLICLDQEDARLWSTAREGKVAATPLFRQLEALVREVRPSLVIAEALADLSGINENVRSEVVQGLRPARILARQTGTCFLFISHPSRAGQALGTGESGSTHWRNTVRAWLNFTLDPDDKNVRLLASTKTNYSGLNSEPKRLTWSRGEYVPVAGMGTPERAAAEAAVDAAFLRCLAARTARGFEDGPNTGKNYAPHIYAQMPEANGLTKKALEASMHRLIAANRVGLVKVGPKSRAKQVLVAVVK